MPQIINTNISSLTAQRNLNTSQSDQAQALERLSSGLRINSAKDDAAGLAISTRFTSQTRGLSVAIRNAGDGISLSQTAEGALGSMSDNLQRIRELALQSANGTNSDSDREALNAEAQQLIAEITRTADQTNFNGRNLLDGSFSSQFQIGANSGEVIEVSVNKLTADSIGAAETAGVSAIGTGAALANGDLIINGVAIDPSQASSDTASTADASFSAIAKVEAINAKSDETGVTAEVIDNVASGSEMTAAATTGTLTLNGVDIDLATGGVSASDDRNAVISAINARSDQTGVVASDGGDAGGVTLTAADGRNIDVSLGGTLTGASTGLAEGTSYGGYTLISKDGTDISIDGGNGTGTGDLSNSGLTAGVYSGREATLNTLERNLSSQTTDTSGTFSTADMNISADTVINATNNTFEISVDGAAFELVTLGTSFDAGSGAGEYDNAAQLAAQINDAIVNGASNANLRDASGNALVVASDNGNGGITFTSASGGEGSEVVARTGAGNIALPTDSVEAAGTAAGTFFTADIDFTFDGTNTLSLTNGATDSINIDLGTQGNATLDLVTTDTDYTSAQDFADDVNDAIALNATLAGNVEAQVSDDGKTVSLVTLQDSGTTNVDGLSLGAATTITASQVVENVEHLSNGDVVITDPALFAANFNETGGDTFSIAVDGLPALDLELSLTDVRAYADANPGSAYDAASTANGGAITDASVLAAAIQYEADTSLAGSGITATVVGGQIVISSNSEGGTVEVGDALVAANTIGGSETDDIGLEAAATTFTTDATSGTAITGDFSVDADGNFISEDPDGAGTDFEAQLSPLVVTAGENDTFQIALDGGAATDVTVAAGTYNNMDELAAAINDALADPVVTPASAGSVTSTATDSGSYLGADLSAVAGTEFDFSTNNLSFNITIDGVAGAAAITIDDNLANADLDVAGAALAAQIQSDIEGDANFSAGDVVVTWDATKDAISIVSGTTGSTSSISLTGASATAGTGNTVSFLGADGGTTGTDTIAATELDFSANNITFDLALDGGTAQTFTIDDNQGGAADFATGMAAIAASLETDINAGFGAGSVTVAYNATSGGFDITSTSTGTSSSVTITNATTGGTDGGVSLIQNSTNTGSASSTSTTASVAVSADNQSFTFTSSTSGTTSSVDITNGTLAIEGGFTSGTTVTGDVAVNALESGDLVINGTSIRGADGNDDTASDETALTSDASASGIATAAAINASTEQTGVTATVNATELNGGDGTAALTADDGSTGTVIINNVEATPITLTGDADADRAAAVNAINSISGQTGVVAEDNGKSITLTAADGRNISVAIDNNLAGNAVSGLDSSNFGRSIGLSADDAGIGEADITGTGATYGNVAGTTYSTVQLTSAGQISVEAGENGADELAALGLKEGSYGSGDNGIFISEIDISTFQGANDALVAIDNALNQVSAERANLGAIQNRFQSTISNLEITSENLTAANSRIRDADFAAETAALSRSQVLQQAGISILAQANALPQQALSLLQ